MLIVNYDFNYRGPMVDLIHGPPTVVEDWSASLVEIRSKLSEYYNIWKRMNCTIC